jgi:hypothetical protein
MKAETWSLIEAIRDGRVEPDIDWEEFAKTMEMAIAVLFDEVGGCTYAAQVGLKIAHAALDARRSEREREQEARELALTLLEITQCHLH